MFKAAAEKEKKGIDKIKALGRAYFEFYKKEPDYFTSMLHQDIHPFDPETIKKNPNYARCSEIGNNIFGLMQKAVTTGVTDGTIRQDLDPVKLSLVLWSHSAGTLHIFKTKEAMIKNMFKLSVEEIVEYSYRLIEEYLRNKEEYKELK
jgi:hypothetical protein